MEPAIRTANLGDLEAVQRIARAAYALYVLLEQFQGL
jgi:hypothetical protein